MIPVYFRRRRSKPGTGHLVRVVRGSAAVTGSRGSRTRTLLAFLALACVPAVGALGLFGPGVHPARGEPVTEERKELLRQQRERYEAGVALNEELDDKLHKLADLFRLKLQNDRLVIDPGIPATPFHRVYRVQVEGQPSPATIVFVESIGRRPGVGRSRFDFSAEKFDEDAGVYGRLRVMTYTHNLRLMQSYRSGDKQWDVSLEETGDEVRLSVSGTGIDPVNVGEPDFIALRRRHPREAQQWLRPMLLELGQEKLLVPDAQAAWQVLADEWPEQANARQMVLKTLPDLAAADFHVREAAARKLVELGLPGATTILRLDREGVRADLSCEQNRELDAVVAAHRALPAEEAAALHDDPDFLLDCLSCEDPTAREVALRRLQKLTEAAAGFNAKDLDADRDHRAAAVANLREKVMSATTKPSK